MMQHHWIAAFAAFSLLVTLVSPVLADVDEPSAATSEESDAFTASSEESTWIAVHRETGLWSNKNSKATLFRTVHPGAHFKAILPQKGPRLYVWDPLSENYAYINAADVGPVGEPKGETLDAQRWITAHRATGLWSNHAGDAALFRTVRAGSTFRVVSPQQGSRIHVWDPNTENYAYIDAADVGPTGPPGTLAEPEVVKPISYIWSGTARVSMYTCVELRGCNRTAIGLWPYEGVVAVDPRVIPLGSTVWLDGLGLFLAADTGSAVRGNHIDVFVHDYRRAINWGIRYVNGAAYWPQ